MLNLVSTSSPDSASAPASTASADRPSADRPSDDELAALRRRDPDAIERWVVGNREIVHRLLMKMVKDPETARELLQETLYQALRSVSRFRGDAKVSTWLCGIARNLALRHFRDQKRYTTAESDVLERMRYTDTSSASVSPYEMSPRTHAERSERYHLVHTALDELPDTYREIIRMRDLEEQSTREVAEALGLSRVNVRVRLHRARKKMKKILRPRFDDTLSRAA